MTERIGGMARDHTEWWSIEARQAIDLLESQDSGLTEAEARARLEIYGPNELEEDEGGKLFEAIVRQFKSPLIYILILASLFATLLGEYIDAAIIAAVLGINAVLGTFQEYRAERSMEALRRVASARAHVIRDAHEWEIDARQLVPGDIVVVEAGSRVPADCRLLFAAALEADESLLTGESSTVGKGANPVPADVPVGDRASMLFMGSTITRGRGRAVVTTTGAATEVGKIAGTVRETADITAPIVERMNRFARIIAILVLVSSLLGLSVGLALGQDMDELFLTLVGLMVAAVPEGLPIVLTVTLAIGVNRMAKRNVIIRRLPAVETLGSCTVIGSDKTGTLTQNRMTVSRIYTGERHYRVSGLGYEPSGQIWDEAESGSREEDETLRLILLGGVLNNTASIEQTESGEYDVIGDPTEIALLVAGAKADIWKEQAEEEYPRWAEVPFDSEARYAATFHRHGDSSVTFVKGAPEEVLAMCESSHSAGELDSAAVLDVAASMAREGLRVLGFACREDDAPDASVDIPEHRTGLVFLGLQGMIDPPREEVRESIRACQDAGIRVLMVTGDHATTAVAIAQELGITDDENAITGRDIDEMGPDGLQTEVARTSVFARVSPEHKLQIVQALQSRGEVVAVTGDGVNDGPALKAANIGVAMGRSGTDVAKEASDMVITDDNFVSIFNAVEEGRIVFDNIRKVTFFLIPTGAAVILTVLASIFFDFSLPFLPAQLLWLNLVTNGIQDVFLAFEPGEKDVLKRKPRPVSEGIISPLLWERTALAGIVMAAGTTLLFLDKIDAGVSLEEARTTALTAMVVFQVLHIGNSRSEHQSAFARSPLLNPLLFVGTLAGVSIHFGALYWGPSQEVLRVQPLQLEDWVRIAVVASTVIIAVEVHKALRGPGRPFALK